MLAAGEVLGEESKSRLTAPSPLTAVSLVMRLPYVVASLQVI